VKKNPKTIKLETVVSQCSTVVRNTVVRA